MTIIPATGTTVLLDPADDLSRAENLPSSWDTDGDEEERAVRHLRDALIDAYTEAMCAAADALAAATGTPVRVLVGTAGGPRDGYAEVHRTGPALRWIDEEYDGESSTCWQQMCDRVEIDPGWITGVPEDGWTLAVAGPDGAVRTWHVATGAVAAARAADAAQAAADAQG